MPLDVLEKLNNAKQEAISNEQPTQNLDTVFEKLDIITEKAKSSSEAMNALQGIVSGLSASGDNLSQSLDKVCFYFERFEQRSERRRQRRTVRFVRLHHLSLRQRRRIGVGRHQYGGK
jgi:hypothetical protein